ncbi:MAG TPA: FtsX-like permease family protein, partial [Lacunisphaera sp.]|nr:FtsX-like permease family protein [Lacunisphaera sp.]
FDTTFGPLADTPQAQQFGTIVIRPRGGQRPEALAAAVQDIVRKVDPNLPLYFVGTPRVALDSFLSQLRLTAVMFTTFGFIAIVLASVGLYGVMSFSVNQRSQEFGVRMALGADAARILRMVLGQGAWQLGIGLGLGVLATAGVAWGFSGPLANFLFQTNPLDPLPYLGVIGLVTLVSLAAILIPARRATRVDPMIALRAQ